MNRARPAQVLAVVCCLSCEFGVLVSSLLKRDFRSCSLLVEQLAQVLEVGVCLYAFFARGAQLVS